MSTEQQDLNFTVDQLNAIALRFANKAKRSGITDEDIQRVLGPSVGQVESLQKVRDSQEENALEAFGRLGLVGCISDGPADLATNPEYMEGFGQDDPASSR